MGLIRANSAWQSSELLFKTRFDALVELGTFFGEVDSISIARRGNQITVVRPRGTEIAAEDSVGFDGRSLAGREGDR